jgi:hypothetical protein
MERPPQFLDSVARRESFAPGQFVYSTATGSRTSKAQKLFRLGHFGIPLL